ncbi:phosphotransferase [Amycolatopsis antarctica]|uniref:Phosphotransferase n=1 Tax=Amycolatopsis antarctica TaxID=1854586 RepID=A0A263D3H9_9PSEU|nr:phosphotransferase [Amycolatopsis antarctica]OZM73032.1 phosphotransferase [Amycolatopsis antarctica]
MTVDTSPADDSTTVGGGAEYLAIEAAVAAGEAVLAHRFGSAIPLIEPEDLAGSGPATVVRARIASSPFALPRTLVIKHYPAAPGGDVPDPFAQEAVSYQLFTALAKEDRMCPELLAHDGEHRVLVVEDLGRAPTLQDKLAGSDARGAERALLSWARSLGRLHAGTASREADFNALLRRLGGPVHGEDTTPVLACAQLPALIEDTLGLVVPEEVGRRAERAAEDARSMSFRAFSPVDLWPDNNLVTGDGVRFLDFERGRVRNALVDAAYLRVPFASSPHALALPAGMSEAMIAAWRSEVTPIWPVLAEEDELSRYLLDGQLLWVWITTWELLRRLRPGAPAGASGRAAALVTYWQELARQAERAGADVLAGHAAEVGAAVDERFGPGLRLALYPAFR